MMIRYRNPGNVGHILEKNVCALDGFICRVILNIQSDFEHT